MVKLEMNCQSHFTGLCNMIVRFAKFKAFPSVINSLENFCVRNKKNIFALRIRDVAQPGSVLAWGARGRWFESSHPD